MQSKDNAQETQDQIANIQGTKIASFVNLFEDSMISVLKDLKHCSIASCDQFFQFSYNNCSW
jgi:hypothetical protein